MTRRFFSFRFLLLSMACFAAAFLWIDTHQEPTLARTGRELDLAILGPGYFSITDPHDSDIVRYTRNGKFYIDSFGSLSIDIDGQTWNMEPYISLPSDANRISIQSDGRFQYMVSPDSCWTDIGDIQLTLFTASIPFSNPLLANEEDETSGTPMDVSAGEEFGSFQQGWLERSPSIFNLIAKPLILALLASVVINLLLEIRDLLAANVRVN